MKAGNRPRARWIVGSGAGVAIAAIGLAHAAPSPTGIARPAVANAFHLVFTSDRDGDADLYAVGARGGRFVALTRNRVDDSFALVAPSGGSFVNRGSNGFIVSANGRRERNLGHAYWQAALSADGRQLAFAREDGEGENDRVAVVPLSGGRIRYFAKGVPEAFSRDGRFLGFTSAAGAPGVIDLRTDRPSILPSPTYSHQDWMWSPHVARLAYLEEIRDSGDEKLVVVGARPRARPKTVARGNLEAQWLDDRRLGVVDYDRNELDVVDARAGTERVVAGVNDTSDLYGLGFAEWSPRGDAVAYLVGGSPTEMVVARIGGRETRVDLGNRRAGSLTWSPRGDRIAFDLNGQLHVLDLALSPRLRLVAAGVRADYDVVWSPDERSLAVAQRSGLAIVPAVGGGRPALIPLGDLPKTLAWARGRLPRAAPTAASTPQLDTRTKRLHRRVPRTGTLLSFAGTVTAFAQDGSRLAWVRNTPRVDGPFPSVVEVLDARNATRTAIGGIRGHSSDTNPGLYPAAFSFGGDRAVLIDMTGGVCGNAACYYDVLTASLADRRLRAVEAMEYERDEGEFPNPADELPVLAAGDGGVVVYYSRCFATEDCGGGGSVVRRLSGRRHANIAQVRFPTALAVARDRVAIAERTDRQTPNSSGPSRPTSTISVRKAAGGALVTKFDLAGAVYSLALSPSRVAALARDRQRAWIELRDAQSGALIRRAAIPGGSSTVSIAGESVVFRTGRIIRLLDAATGRISVLATAASSPIGLSIEGRRVAWAENLRSHARIRAITVRGK